MSKLSVFILVAAIASAACTVAASAQSFDPDGGTGNIVPFNNFPGVPQRERMAVRHSGRSVVAARATGLHAFAAVPVGGASRGSTYDPALTGGGSPGYNQNLANY